MNNIIYTILLFNVLIIIFKQFQKYKVANLQGLIVNYATAAICALLYFNNTVTLNAILTADWIVHAVSMGFLFIIVFMFYSFGTQKIGISITTVANKMSVIIPVSVSLALYPSASLTLNLGIGLIFALAGIYFSSTEAGKINFDSKYLGAILFIFIGQGIADSIFNDFAQQFPNENNYLYFMVLFASASISGILILLISSFKNKVKLQAKSIYWGVALGIPNFFSLVFFLKALQTLNSTVVFPLISIGVVLTSTLVGVLLYKEQLSRLNWFGILLSSFAIYLLS